MSLVNLNTKEVHCKIVYYGPGLGGKTTNLQYVYQKISGGSGKPIINIDGDNERTLFFDFLPLELGEIRGFKTRFHLYTVPGQAFYEASRRLVLRGVDGIIFVADSQLDRMEANIESLEDLQKNLKEHGYKMENVPIVLQWNKRDLPNIAPINKLQEKLNKWNAPTFEACAISGQGVFETLKMMSKLVLMNLRGGIHKPSEGRV
jgi:mutual gliding-motility protein MglA